MDTAETGVTPPVSATETAEPAMLHTPVHSEIPVNSDRPSPGRRSATHLQEKR